MIRFHSPLSAAPPAVPRFVGSSVCCWPPRRSLRGSRSAGRGRASHHRRRHLRRPARRLRLQPGAGRGRGRSQEDARRQGRRGRERARDGRRAEDHGRHDRRRTAPTLLFPTSFGYFDPHMLAVAAKNPEGHASPTAAASGPRASTRRTPAATSATSTSASTSTASSPATRARARSSASSPPSRSRRCCATSTPSRWARARSNPKITTTVIFTGDWSMPVKEAEATNSLVDQGVDVFTMHVDGPKVIVETAEQARQDGLRLPRQPGQAGAQGLPDRRRVELAHGVHRLVEAARRPASRTRTSCAAA